MKEEDLILQSSKATEEDLGEEMDAEFYDYDDIQMLVAACEGLAAVEGINAMTAADNKRITRVKRKCLRMIDFYVGELYDMTFDKDEADNENE
jgi:hypothetical protein